MARSARSARGWTLALALAVAGCEDPPVETPPDPGGPGTGDELGDATGTSTDGDTDSDGGTSTDDGSSSDESSSSSESSGSESSGSESADTGESTDTGGGIDFAAPVTTEVFAFIDMQLADLDADGCADLVLSGTGAPPRVNIYPSDCDGGFGAVVTREISSFDAFVLGDLDGDARADLITSGSGFPPRLEAYLVDANLELAGVVITEVYTHDLLWAADLDGDGRSELLIHDLDALPPTITSYTPSLGAALDELATAEIGSLDQGAVGRVDDDARVDFVAGIGDAPLVNPWLSQGDGGLLSGDLFWPFTFSKLALADLDGDGLDELLTDVPGNDWRVSIYANVGAGFSELPEDLSAVTYTLLRAADVDGDGDGDLVLAPTGQPPRVMVWRTN